MKALFLTTFIIFTAIMVFLLFQFMYSYVSDLAVVGIFFSAIIIEGSQYV